MHFLWSCCLKAVLSVVHGSCRRQQRATNGIKAPFLLSVVLFLVAVLPKMVMKSLEDCVILVLFAKAVFYRRSCCLEAVLSAVHGSWTAAEVADVWMSELGGLTPCRQQRPSIGRPRGAVAPLKRQRFN